jgi:uncharacterized membrane protein/predicted DsbA family dithiol-disulfide isomerase
MSPLSRRLVWVLAICGLAASATSLYVHYQMLAQPGYVSFCDINQTVSCQQAYLSRFGSVWGVPVALYGMIWFVFVLVLALVGAAGPESVREAMPAYLFATATVGLAVILYMAYAAFFVLKAVCVLCLATYAAVIGLFIVSGLSKSMPPMTTLPRRVFGDVRAVAARPALLSVVIVFLAGAVSAIAFFPDEAVLRRKAAETQAARPVTADQRSEFERFWDAQPRVTVPVPADGSAVLIVKFSDLQCPQCGVTFFDVRPVLSKYRAQFPGAVRMVTMDFPLQPECNVTMPRPLHTAACDAAVAVRLAKQRLKGESLEEYFYGHQSTMSPATVRDAAFAIAGVQDFDLQYPRVIAEVKADVAVGQKLGVTGTPTFFINGVRLVAPAPQTIDLAIAYELKKAGRIK